jgi:rRNA-processing protein FCF1
MARRRLISVHVRLAPGKTVDDAIRTMETLATNAYGAAMPPGMGASELRDAYVRWTIGCEQTLLTVLTRSDIDRIFENTRHRDICAMPLGTQWQMLISAEVNVKAAQLTEIANHLRDARDRITRSPGLPTLVDTNLLLECLRPDQIKWEELVGETARLMVPLRVIEELDTKKYDGKERLRQTARDLLPWIEGLFSGPDVGPVPLDGRGTTIEMLMVDRPRYRPTDADEEVLDAYHEVKLLSGRAKLVTADTGMRLRARGEGIDVIGMPIKYLRLA